MPRPSILNKIFNKYFKIIIRIQRNKVSKTHGVIFLLN